MRPTNTRKHRLGRTIGRMLMAVAVVVAPAVAADYDYDPSYDYRAAPQPSYIHPQAYGYAYDPYGSRNKTAYSDRYVVTRPSRFGWSVYDTQRPGLGLVARPLPPATLPPTVTQRNLPSFETFGYVPPAVTEQNMPPLVVPAVPTTQPQQQPRQAQSALAAAERKPQSFEGRILELSQITARRDNKVYWIAWVREPDGNLQAVSVGPTRYFPLKQGDWLRGTGTPDVLQGRPVLLANNVQVNDGQWQAVDRQLAQPARNYSGRVLAVNTLYLEGLPDRQIMADVHLAGGQVASVLLGPANTVRLDFIHLGDTISFWATSVSVNNLPVLMTQQFQIEGQQFTNAYPIQQVRFETR